MKQFPIEIKRGSVTVRIYRTAGISGHGPRFTLVWYEGVHRRRKTFQKGKALARAQAEAEAWANKLATGEAEALQLTSGDRHAYVRARAALQPFGIALDSAVLEYAEAKKLLGDIPLSEAAREFVKRHPRSLPKKSVPEVFDEMLREKKRLRLSESYLNDLRLRCGRFAEAFAVPVASVTAADARGFLSGLNGSPRTHNNFVNAIRSLFAFARSRGYLPKDYDELDGLEKLKEVGGEIEIFTPSEMARLIDAAPEDFLPPLAIGAFAGLRSAEILRLEWSDVNLTTRFMTVGRDKAKTAQRRLVPIQDNLLQWLAPYVQSPGPLASETERHERETALTARPTNKVWPHGPAYFHEIQRETAARTKSKKLQAVEWKHNALRHSFISYRLAETQNANQVALEAGNSPQMIFAHYRELVTPTDAKTWFGLAPIATGNVTQLPAANESSRAVSA